MAAAVAAARVFRAVGPAPPPGGAAPDLLTVVSYNLLADKFASSGAHDYCPAQFLTWAQRGPKLIAELLGYRAHVICLQEVERPFMEGELEPALQREGYEVRARAPALQPAATPACLPRPSTPRLTPAGARAPAPATPRAIGPVRASAVSTHPLLALPRAAVRAGPVLRAAAQAHRRGARP
jgi:hypothetical protein